MSMRGIALACLAAVVAACSSSSSGGDAGLQCPSGSVVCGSACSNVQGDPQNCGKCGVVCAHGEICDLGACTTGISDAARDTASDAPSDTASETGPASDAAAESAADAATDAASATDAATD
jgi:hypothetical protein